MAALAQQLWTILAGHFDPVTAVITLVLVPIVTVIGLVLRRF